MMEDKTKGRSFLNHNPVVAGQVEDESRIRSILRVPSPRETRLQVAAGALARYIGSRNRVQSLEGMPQ